MPSASFRNIGEIDWNDGAYEINYYTQTGEVKNVNIDPVSGKPRR